MYQITHEFQSPATHAWKHKYLNLLKKQMCIKIEKK